MQRSRLGNVTGAVLLRDGCARAGRVKVPLESQVELGSTRAARLLDGLFEETLLVGGEWEAAAPGRRVAGSESPRCPLAGVVAALEAASRERVLVITSDLALPSPDVLLALTAWPEQDAVVSCDAEGAPSCVIYRREAVLRFAQELLADDRLSFEALFARIDTARVTLDELGLGDLLSRPPENANAPDESVGFGRAGGR